MGKPLPAPTSSPARFLTREQLRVDKGLPVSNMTLLRWEKAGTFPRRIHLSPCVTIWLESEVDAYVLARRDAPSTITSKATAAHMAKRREQVR